MTHAGLIDQALAFVEPDYAGGGAANLMASLVSALAPRQRERCEGVPPSRYIDVARIAAARHVVLLVIDGLGASQLAAHGEDSFLAGALSAQMSAVFPSTTSSAITTYMTAWPPVRHGLTGWHTWFPTLGAIATPLPFTVRADGGSLADAVNSPTELFSGLGLFDAMQRPAQLIQPSGLANSHYTRAHSGRAQVRGFSGFAGLCSELRRVARGESPSFAYAYWPELDLHSHVHGSFSTTTGAHFGDIDRQLSSLWQELANTGTLLLVTSDHGFVDTEPTTCHQLANHAELAECLLMPLSGEPRTVFCHLRRGAEADFLSYVKAHLAHACEVHASEALVDRGVFGPPSLAHRELRARVGDYTLLMRDNHALVDRLAREGPFRQVGVHGGMSEAEMRIPLIALGP